MAHRVVTRPEQEGILTSHGHAREKFRVLTHAQALAELWRREEKRRATRARLAWYGDDQESALIKGCIVGLLTAIPVGIPAILTASSGLVGFLHKAGKKDSSK